MDENYAAKTRHTRQLLGELNRISGSPGYEISGPKAIIANDLHENENIKMLRSTIAPASLYKTESKESNKLKTKTFSDLMKGKPKMQNKYHSEEALHAESPNSLELLQHLHALFIVHELEVLEITSQDEAVVRYVVQNIDGDRLFFAIEESSILAKLCLCSRRPFNLMVFDNDNKHIMNIHRRYKAYFERAKVYAPPDVFIGTIEQKFTCIGSLFVVRDVSGEILQKLQGPPWSFLKCGQLNYKILSHDSKMNIGLISSEWEGLGGELSTDFQHLGIAFPQDLYCRTKTLLLSATLLLSITMYDN